MIREKALELTRFLRQKDWVGQIKTLHSFVQNNIRYTRDIHGVETLHTAQKILEQGQGDCDDKSILLAALLGSIGHPTRFRAVGFHPGKLSHVFVETKIGNKWQPLETTEPVSIGWKPRKVAENMIVYN